MSIRKKSMEYRKFYGFCKTTCKSHRTFAIITTKVIGLLEALCIEKY